MPLRRLRSLFGWLREAWGLARPEPEPDPQRPSFNPIVSMTDFDRLLAFSGVRLTESQERAVRQLVSRGLVGRSGLIEALNVVGERSREEQRRQRLMPSKQLLFVVGEVQKGGDREQVMRSFGGKYIGVGRGSRLRVLLVDLPKAGVLPVLTGHSDFSVQLPGGQAIGSLWEFPEQAISRLDGYFGYSGGFTRSLTVRDLFSVTVTGVDETEIPGNTFPVGGSVSAHAYLMGDTVKAYLIYTGVPRVLLGHGDWFKFKQGVEKTGKRLEVAPPIGEFAGKMGGDLTTALTVGLAGSAVTNLGDELPGAQSGPTLEEQLGF